MIKELCDKIIDNLSMTIAIALVAASIFFLGIVNFLTSKIGWVVLLVASGFALYWWLKHKSYYFPK